MNAASAISSSLTPMSGDKLGATSAGARRDGDFSSALTSMLGGRPTDAKKSPREAAQEFVAIALVQPVLAQMREMNDAWGPFKPSDAERRFAPMLDAEIAQRIVQKEGWGLVDAIETKLARNAGLEATA